jgi:hypothetical protein
VREEEWCNFSGKYGSKQEKDIDRGNDCLARKCCFLTPVFDALVREALMRGGTKRACDGRAEARDDDNRNLNGEET